MMKGSAIQQQQLAADENMSNLTSASGDQASVSSHPLAPPPKKKRNLPGNPDPDAEVIALSPRTLMATNRFVCEICNKGFQRDQNLQLHRRGHNLPWKLKQRNPKDAVRKKVYVCPEPGCVHHDAARALGDLTGIKKHFSRKHGEKKWKCDKCSKKYAVHSDWKAHSKVCGTREYRCDCGTLFSRRDSFITHRAFCDALAEESARAVTAAAAVGSHAPGLLFAHNGSSTSSPLQLSGAGPSQPLSGHGLVQEMYLKREQQQLVPSWLAQQQMELPASAASSMFGARLEGEYTGSTAPESTAQAAASFGFSAVPAAAPSTPQPHMSATALLQKAAQMGATLSRPSNQGQMASVTASANATTNVTTTSSSVGFCLGSQASAFGDQDRARIEGEVGNPDGRGNAGRSGGGGNDSLTRDFLGLRAFSHGDILSMAGFDTCMASSSVYEQGHQSKNPWHG